MDKETVLKLKTQALLGDLFLELVEPDCLKPQTPRGTWLIVVSRKDVLQNYHNHILYPE